MPLSPPGMEAGISPVPSLRGAAVRFPELLAVGLGPPDLPPEHLPHATLVSDRTPSSLAESRMDPGSLAGQIALPLRATGSPLGHAASPGPNSQGAFGLSGRGLSTSHFVDAATFRSRRIAIGLPSPSLAITCAGRSTLPPRCRRGSGVCLAWRCISGTATWSIAGTAAGMQFCGAMISIRRLICGEMRTVCGSERVTNQNYIARLRATSLHDARTDKMPVVARQPFEGTFAPQPVERWDQMA